MSSLRLSGYDDPVLLGFGSLGEVWQARRRGSGETVVLRRLIGVSKQALTTVREQCALVRGLASEHAVQVRTTVRSGDDDVLVLDHASGGSLASVLADRPVLTPGEIVTVLAPLAELLGRAHDAGIVHGRVEVTSVLLDRDGRPLLDGLGLLPLYDPTDSHDPTGALGAAADVWALGALGARLLTGQAPGTQALSAQAPTAPVPLLRALEAALAFDPAHRPSAGELAQALLTSCPAAPLSGTPAVVGAPKAGARGSLRPLAASVGAFVLLVAVVAAGWAWGRQDVARAGSTAPSWASVLQGLDGQRGEAFAQGRVDLLDKVYLPGSAALRADHAVLADLIRHGTTAEGLRHEVRTASVVSVSDGRVELDVRERLAAYGLRSARGEQRQPRGAEVRHRVVLRRTAQGWRLAEVRTF